MLGVHTLVPVPWHYQHGPGLSVFTGKIYGKSSCGWERKEAVASIVSVVGIRYVVLCLTSD